MVGENATIWPAVLGTRVAILAGYSSGERLSGHMRGEVPLACCWNASRLVKEWAKRWARWGLAASRGGEVPLAFRRDLGT